MPLLDHVKQVLLGEAHWNVLDHDSCQHLNAIQDAVEVYRVVRQLRYPAVILMRWWTHVLLEVVAQLLWGHIVSHAKDIIDLGGLRLGRLKHIHH